MAVAPDASGRCERCFETAGFEPSNQPLPTEATVAFPFLEEIVDDALRRLVVARLRARYSEARHLVMPAEPHSPSHANLDWILGARRGPDQDYARFDERFSELIVLWLEDLVLELDGPLLAPYSPEVVPGELPAGVSRESAALGLRLAARDFAHAFLGRRDPVGGV
jgi:hypothetical protein